MGVPGRQGGAGRGRARRPGARVRGGARRRHRACGDRIGGDVPLAHGWAVLRVWLAELVDAASRRPLEHALAALAGPDELDSVPWLPADAPIVAELAKILPPRRHELASA